MINRGLYIRFSEEDCKRVFMYKWTATNCKKHKKDKWYAVTRPVIDGKRVTLYLHRYLTDCPTGMEVDHIDNDGLNNVRDNLKVVSKAENLKKMNADRKKAK